MFIFKLIWCHNLITSYYVYFKTNRLFISVLRKLIFPVVWVIFSLE